jgi:hypothetical protein
MDLTGAIFLFGGLIIFSFILVFFIIYNSYQFIKKSNSKKTVPLIVVTGAIVFFTYLGYLIYQITKRNQPYNLFKHFSFFWNPFDIQPRPIAETDIDTETEEEKIARLKPHGDLPTDETLMCLFENADRAYSYKTPTIPIQQSTSRDYSVEPDGTIVQSSSVSDYKELCLNCDQYLYKDQEGQCVQYEYDLDKNQPIELNPDNSDYGKHETITQGVCTVGLQLSKDCDSFGN